VYYPVIAGELQDKIIVGRGLDVLAPSDGRGELP